MNKIINYLSVVCFGLLFFISCSNNEENQKEQKNDSSTSKEFSLTGKYITVTYPDMKAEITYTSDSTLHWKTIQENNQIAEGDEKMNYKCVGDSLFFINWIEKDGVTVSQVVDFKHEKVTVFLSMHDDNSSHGQRGSVFFEGKLKVNN